jgi:outer membrane protein OmpA-like peptidoglycan-associated protein
MRLPMPIWVLPTLLAAATPAIARLPPMVWFETGSVRLGARGEAELDWAVAWLRETRAEHISIGGHADRVGSAAANLRLSRRRAEAVREALVRRGFPADRIEIRAFGETRPLIETADGVPERQNRYAIVVIEQMAPPAR